MTDYAKLRELAQNATPGPWHIDHLESGEHGLFIDQDRAEDAGLGCMSTEVAGFMTHANAHYLGALAPDVVLALLDEIDALRRGQGSAPAPAAAVPVALHEAHPIPDSTATDTA